LLRAFAETRSYGMPMDTIIDVHERLPPVLDDVARVLVEAGAQHVAGKLPRPEQLTDSSVSEVVTMLLRFRTLAMDSVLATLEHAIERRVEALLAAYLVQVAGTPTSPGLGFGGRRQAG
jgi:hypothetical protein